VAEAFASRGIAGLILAGGQGARMNGQDKGLVVLRGEPMVAHVARRLAPQVSRLVISANRHLDLYARYGAVVQDGEADLGAWQGPLLGIAAGLEAARQEAWLVVAPCDTPFLPKDGQRHSACMALRTSLLPDLLAYLRAGDRKVGLWQARMGAVEACFDDAPDAFMNVNTPDELARAERYASQ
jgi:molybdopterin-guanine dinucleotide biosynthesis protein A